MNYARKQWDKRHKRNPYAKELEEDRYRQRKISSKKHNNKLNPREIETLINDREDDLS